MYKTIPSELLKKLRKLVYNISNNEIMNAYLKIYHNYEDI